MHKHKRVFITCVYFVIVASIVSHAHAHAHDLNIASLIQQLEHTDADVRDSTYKSLVETGEAAVPALIVMGLNHEKAVVRDRVVMILHEIRERAPHNKDIVRALAKALRDRGVRTRIIFGFRPPESNLELPPEVISGLVQMLYYESPFFGGTSVGEDLLAWTGNQGRAALAEALHSSEWSLRFGAALAYGGMLGYTKRTTNNPDEGALPKAVISPKEVISIVAEGLTHPDWKTQEKAADVLAGLARTDPTRLLGETAGAFDEAGKALEGLPPFGIIFQTIHDGDYISGPDSYIPTISLKSLNTDGITFKFNRSIDRVGEITIRPVTEIHDEEERTHKTVYGEPLGWNREKSSHSVTITPKKGQELVKGQTYMIELRDFEDVVGDQVDADIEFRIKGDKDFQFPPRIRTIPRH